MLFAMYVVVFPSLMLNVGVCSLIIDGWIGAQWMGGWMCTVAKLVKKYQKNYLFQFFNNTEFQINECTTYLQMFYLEKPLKNV